MRRKGGPLNKRVVHIAYRNVCSLHRFVENVILQIKYENCFLDYTFLNHFTTFVKDCGYTTGTDRNGAAVQTPVAVSNETLTFMSARVTGAVQKETPRPVPQIVTAYFKKTKNFSNPHSFYTPLMPQK